MSYCGDRLSLILNQMLYFLKKLKKTNDRNDRMLRRLTNHLIPENKSIPKYPIAFSYPIEPSEPRYASTTITSQPSDFSYQVTSEDYVSGSNFLTDFINRKSIPAITSNRDQSISCTSKIEPDLGTVKMPSCSDKTAPEYASVKGTVKMPSCSDKTAPEYASAKGTVKMPSCSDKTAPEYASAKGTVKMPSCSDKNYSDKCDSSNKKIGLKKGFLVK